VLPGVLNLSSASASHAALVNVASAQQPAILRVAPGNADNSYLIDKLEGTAPPPTNSQMPLLGQPLSPATIATIRQWIDNGAAM
jgi:hypothetical protein